MADPGTLLQLGLRWLHFVGGFIWLGALGFLTLVLSPTLNRLSAGERVSVLGALAPRLSGVLIASSMLNVVAGVALALLRSNLETGIFLASRWGLAILTGALLALAMLVVTAAIILPVLERYSPHPESERIADVSATEAGLLEARLRRWAGVGTVLGIAALFLMALAVSSL